MSNQGEPVKSAAAPRAQSSQKRILLVLSQAARSSSPKSHGKGNSSGIQSCVHPIEASVVRPRRRTVIAESPKYSFAVLFRLRVLQSPGCPLAARYARKHRRTSSRTGVLEGFDRAGIDYTSHGNSWTLAPNVSNPDVGYAVQPNSLRAKRARATAQSRSANVLAMFRSFPCRRLAGRRRVQNAREKRDLKFPFVTAIHEVILREAATTRPGT